MNADAAASIVATVLLADTATAYAPTDPAFGIVVIPDETWIGPLYVEYLRIDGLGTVGHATRVELHTTGGTFTSDPTDTEAELVNRIPARILAAINAVIGA